MTVRRSRKEKDNNLDHLELRFGYHSSFTWNRILNSYLADSSTGRLGGKNIWLSARRKAKSKLNAGVTFICLHSFWHIDSAQSVPVTNSTVSY